MCIKTRRAPFRSILHSLKRRSEMMVHEVVAVPSLILNGKIYGNGDVTRRRMIGGGKLHAQPSFKSVRSVKSHSSQQVPADYEDAHACVPLAIQSFLWRQSK